MNLSTLDLGVILAYFLFLVGIGIYFSKRASRDMESYFLGGRKIPWWVLGISGSFSNISLTGIMLMSTLLCIFGLKGFWIGIRGDLGLYVIIFGTIVGKWCRRSKCITMAEWIEYRFGKRKDSEIARIAMAITILIGEITSVAFVTVALGMFGHIFLGFSPEVCSILIVGICTIYITISGFYGVAYSDFVQGIIIAIVTCFVTYIAFTQGSMEFSQDFLELAPSWKLEIPAEYQTDYGYFELFGVCLIFWIIRTIFDAIGNLGGYTAQRYLAAKNDRECGLLSLAWIGSLTLRWFLTGSIVVLALTINASPDYAVPSVINEFFPCGLKGLAIAGMIAASMSTFDSHVNSGASYLTNDVWSKLRPQASNKELVLVGRLISLVIIIAGACFGLCAHSLNQILSFYFMIFSSGYVMPLILRWVWWRYNAWGIIAGLAAGMLSIVGKELFFATTPMYIAGPIIMLISLIVSILCALLTSETAPEINYSFYRQTKPMGVWGEAKKRLGRKEIKKRAKENKLDILSMLIGLPWQFCLFLLPVLLMFRSWNNLSVCLPLFVLLSVLLYFVWYRRL